MVDIFPRLFGNDATKARIGAAITSGHIPHAFLIDGPSGSGKYTLALEMAAALNCENKGDGSSPLPCGVCNNCRRIRSGGYVDVHVLAKQRDKATIGVEEIKGLRADMYLTPTESDYKIYIVKDAERMTAEAQNALLIVLEEPPKNVMIMLLASGTDRILTTIKSRSQYIAMSRFSKEDIKKHLLSASADAAMVAKIDPSGFDIAVASADGRIGKALEFVTPGKREALAEDREETMRVVRLLAKNAPYSELYSAINALPQKRPDLAEALERLIAAVGDLIALKYDESAELSFFLTRDEAIGISSSLNTARLFHIFDIINKAHDENSKNANITALISSLTAEIKMA